MLMPPKLHTAADGKLCRDGNKLYRHDDEKCCKGCYVCNPYNSAPPAFKVTLAGNANRPGDPPPCADCVSFNGSYIVPFQSDCVYSATMPDHCDTGGIPKIIVQLTDDGAYPVNDYLLWVTVYYGEPFFPINVLRYQTSFGSSKPNCSEINLNLTYANKVIDEMNICDPESITMDVISL